MSENYENSSPEQIQRDIERTRAEMGDTLDTIRQRLSPGQLLDEALDYVKGSGLSQFSSNLGETVQQNPIPVSLIGIGIAWLAIAGSRPPSTSSTSMTTGRTSSKVGEVAGNATAKAGQVLQGASTRVGEARERIGEMAHHTRYQMGEAASRVQHQTVRARETYNYLRTERPLILGALALAVGAAFGAGLPPTRQEDELMGEMRDEYVHRAKEAGEDYLEQGKRVAVAAGDAAKEQVEKEGGGGYLEQGKRVAVAAGDAAKEQSEREGLTGAEQRRHATEENRQRGTQRSTSRRTTQD